MILSIISVQAVSTPSRSGWPSSVLMVLLPWLGQVLIHMSNKCCHIVATLSSAVLLVAILQA